MCTLAKEWLALRELDTTPSYFRKIKGHINNYIIPAFEGRKPGEIDSVYCQELLIAWSSRTQRPDVICNYAKQIFEWVIEKGLCTTNPFATLKIAPSVPYSRTLRGFPSTYQAIHFQQFMEQLEQADVLTKRIITILLHTGMKVSELVALTWADYEQGVLHVRASAANSKTIQAHPEEKVRTIPVTQTLAILLDDAVEKQVGPYIIGEERIFNTNQVNKLVKAFVQSLTGCPVIETRHLRVLAYFTCVKEGFSEDDCAKIFGFGQDEQTQRLYHQRYEVLNK